MKSPFKTLAILAIVVALAFSAFVVPAQAAQAPVGQGTAQVQQDSPQAEPDPGGLGLEFPLPVGIIAAILIVTKALTDGLARPLFEKFKWDTMGLMYVAWGLGAALVLLAYFLPSDLFALILLCLAIGGGANLLNDLFKGRLFGGGGS